MRAEPVMRDIWSGMQADHQLAALQLAESRECAALARSAFLMWELGEATMRLAVGATPAEGEALIRAYLRMTLRELAHPSAD